MNNNNRIRGRGCWCNITQLRKENIRLEIAERYLKKDIEKLLEVIDKQSSMTLWQHIKYWWNTRRLKRITEKFMRENNK